MPTAIAQAEESRPLILTARMDPQTQAHFQNLRRLYFPPERNIVPAHLTLFHHLPPTLMDEIYDVLKRMAATTPPLPASVKGLRFLGRGVAYDIACPLLQDMRAELAHLWRHLLIPQDQATIRPHVTVQNKVSGDIAKACHAQLQAEFQPHVFHIVGLDLWRYEGGPWTALRSFSFRAARYSA